MSRLKKPTNPSLLHAMATISESSSHIAMTSLWSVCFYSGSFQSITYPAIRQTWWNTHLIMYVPRLKFFSLASPKLSHQLKLSCIAHKALPQIPTLFIFGHDSGPFPNTFSSFWPELPKFSHLFCSFMPMPLNVLFLLPGMPISLPISGIRKLLLVHDSTHVTSKCALVYCYVLGMRVTMVS